MDNGALASALYADAPSAIPDQHSSNEQEQTPLTHEKAADSLYAESKPLPEVKLPPGIQELREADEGRKLYGAQEQFAHVIKETDFFPDGKEGIEHITPEQRQIIVAELREMAADAHMETQDVSSIQSIARSIKEAPSTEQRAEWRDQAVQRLNETYGADAASMAKAAIRFAQADPRRMAMLNQNGLGDHPDVVLMFARLARKDAIMRRT